MSDFMDEIPDISEAPVAEVTDLGEERKKRKAKKSGEQKSTQSEIFYQLIQKMNRDPLAPDDWADFPERYHVLADDLGRLRVLEEKSDRTVTLRVDSAVTNSILRYCYKNLTAVYGADLSHASAEGCRKLWLALTNCADVDPVTLVEQSDPRLAFSRLNFDAPVAHDDEWGAVVVPPLPTYFGEIIGRCDQKDALCAFIGSLFYPEADRQQYCYVQGNGFEGKGALLQFLYGLLGPAAESLQPPKGDARFWNMRIYGKRLVMFSDCEDFRFFSSPELKTLTGGDPIYFEAKGESGFSDIPMCKLLAASNFDPVISTQLSDLRRLIHVKISPIPGQKVIPRYDQLLLAESAAIVSYCKAIYEKLCPDHGPIPCIAAMDLAVESEDFYLSIFHRYFEVAPQDYFATGHAVLSCLQQTSLHRGADIAKMKGSWERNLGVQCKRFKSGVRYWGMKLICEPAPDVGCPPTSPLHHPPTSV